MDASLYDVTFFCSLNWQWVEERWLAGDEESLRASLDLRIKPEHRFRPYPGKSEKKDSLKIERVQRMTEPTRLHSNVD